MAFPGVFKRNFPPQVQGAKKFIFTVCHSGKLKLAFTSPDVISTSPKNVLMSRLISQFFCKLNSSKKFTFPSGKLITEFTSPIAKSTSPGLLDTTFFARWDAMLFRENTHKTRNNAVKMSQVFHEIERFERFTDLNLFKYASVSFKTGNFIRWCLFFVSSYGGRIWK